LTSAGSGASWGQYDITLKHVIRVSAKAFLRQMGIEGRVVPVRTDFPNTKERRVDFLAVFEGPDRKKRLLRSLLSCALTAPSRMW
jgi:hypothetical protein